MMRGLAFISLYQQVRDLKDALDEFGAKCLYKVGHPETRGGDIQIGQDLQVFAAEAASQMNDALLYLQALIISKEEENDG